jgi:hypothetical protein
MKDDMLEGIAVPLLLDQEEIGVKPLKAPKLAGLLVVGIRLVSSVYQVSVQSARMQAASNQCPG